MPSIRLRRGQDSARLTTLETDLPGHDLAWELCSEYASFQAADGAAEPRLEAPQEGAADKAAVDWLAEARAHRDKGNSVFRVSDKFHSASTEYHRALHCLRRAPRTPESEQLRCQLYVNLAACDLNQQDYAAARKHTTKALKHDPKNVKALYRRAQARKFAAFDLDGAEADLQAALEVAPEEKGIRALLDQIRRSREGAAKKEAAIAKKMFGGARS